MPKIVDHEKRREEIALKAAFVFLELGYKDLGMRQLCNQIGMSKSALYHYFKGKDEIFKAATEAMVKLDTLTLKDCPLAAQASLIERTENFILILNLLAPRHFQEMKLIMEYIGVIGHDQVAQDSSMKMANDKYQKLLAHYVHPDYAKETYTLMLGLLSQQMVQGTPLDKQEISNLVRKVIA